MLKKAGIVVAAAAAALLAVSPLAFAGDKHDHNDDHDGKKKVKVEDVNHVDDSNRALINVADNDVVFNTCTNGDIEPSATTTSLARWRSSARRRRTTSEVNVCKQDADAGDSVEQKIAD